MTTTRRPVTAPGVAAPDPENGPVAGNGIRLRKPVPTDEPVFLEEDPPTEDGTELSVSSTPGPKLAWANRRVAAKRAGWPEGALETCEEVEREHTNWYPNYSAGGTRYRPEPGFYAMPWKYSGGGPAPVCYGRTPRRCLRLSRNTNSVPILVPEVFSVEKEEV